MRLFYDNLIDYAATVVTASSQQADLPGSNVINELSKKVWRTGTAAAPESITFDLGSAKDVTGVILLDHTLTNADTNIELHASTDNFAASDVTVAVLVWASGTIS